ncbi:hypothetical protein [Paenibacillus contaminans]|uniref:DUF2269 domain-containing protein n=1 Tax=Paenibacillus contaminans TaxID=450362 RepID=A0A329LQD0_9BACL|nr:hypothetical protein [Paenibacillus contaminans]RAV09410.1 hypothetical protein DQG23_39635 [Paenibacillus contaminans]
MKRLTITQKKWLLSAHILFSAIMFGVMIAFLILSITAAATKDESILEACYTGMLILAKTSVRASTIGTVATGIALSLMTHWGLLKYYWIIAKEALTLVSIGLGVVGIYIWTSRAADFVAAEGIGAMQSADFLSNRFYLTAGIVLQIVSLGAMFVFSVFKPWGQRKPAK